MEIIWTQMEEAGLRVASCELRGERADVGIHLCESDFYLWRIWSFHGFRFRACFRILVSSGRFWTVSQGWAGGILGVSGRAPRFDDAHRGLWVAAKRVMGVQ